MKAKYWLIKIEPILQFFTLSFALLLCFFCVRWAWSLLNLPGELEVREATMWLHVLTYLQGIDIYDHTQVAYVNMNHGPLDPILKTFLARTLPGLESWQVLRGFAFLVSLALPLTCGALGYIKNRKFSGAAYGALWGSLCYILAGELKPYFLMVGRSDATAILFLCLSIFLAFSLPNRKWAIIVHGAIVALIFLVNFRIAPIAGAAVLFRLSMDSNPLKKDFWLHCLVCFGSFMMVFGLIIIAVFGFNFSLYTSHIFGFFGSGGLGEINAEPKFYWIPPGLRQQAEVYFWGYIILSIYLVIKMFKERFWSGLVILFVAYGGSAIIYMMNAAGGGYYYYFPVLLFFSFVFLLYSLKDKGSAPLAFSLLFAILVLVFGPVKRMNEQHALIRDNSKLSHLFMETIRKLNAESPILTENAYLFLKKYNGAKIDMGDLSYKAWQKKMYDTAFFETSNVHFRNISNPSNQFILTTFTMSPLLKNEIEARFEEKASAPLPPLFTGHGHVKLYQRKIDDAAK